MVRHCVIFIILFVFISCQSKRNVIILYTDDQSHNTIKALGNNEVITPNLDRLVSEGTSFTQAHIPGGNHGALCVPSRAMLLTGRHYMRISDSFINPGAGHDRPGNSEHETMPEMFRNLGYHTFFTGKWHNERAELFDGFTDGDNIYLGGMHWPDDGGHNSPLVREFDPTGIYPDSLIQKKEKFSSALYADAAINFLESNNAKDPFFLYVAFTSPHDPRHAPKKFLELYDTAEISLPPNYMNMHPFDNGHLYTRDENLAPHPRTPAIAKQEIAGYYAMVSEVDHQIGRILKTMDDLGISKNTVLVYAGDNGLAVGQHGLMGKQSIYDHSIRTPLVIRGPGVPRNVKANTLCYLYDIFPTIGDLLSLSLPTSVEGISLTPVFEDHNIALRDELFLSFDKTQRGVVNTDGWKIIKNYVQGKSTTQLFNLNEDPWEKNNLAKDNSNKQKLSFMEARLETYYKEYEDDFIQPGINIEYSDGREFPEVKLSGPSKNIAIHYTINGNDPTSSDPIFDKPFEIRENSIIKARCFRNGNPLSKVVNKEVRIVKGIESIQTNVDPVKKYSAKGPKSLIDGLEGGDGFGNGGWLGYHGENVQISISFEKDMVFDNISIGTLHNPGSWIFAPKSISINIWDANGSKFSNSVAISNISNGRMDIEIPVNFATKRMEIIVEATKECPPGHPGEGKKAWLFMDEIKFN